jgi:hypothetical protein
MRLEDLANGRLVRGIQSRVFHRVCGDGKRGICRFAFATFLTGFLATSIVSSILFLPGVIVTTAVLTAMGVDNRLGLVLGMGRASLLGIVLMGIVGGLLVPGVLCVLAACEAIVTLLVRNKPRR